MKDFFVVARNSKCFHANSELPSGRVLTVKCLPGIVSINVKLIDFLYFRPKLAKRYTDGLVGQK